MKIGILGRTKFLLDTAERLAAAGHTLAFVATNRQSSFDATTPKDFFDLAQKHGVPFFETNHLDEQALAKAGADIGVSVNWLNILPASVLKTFQHGILNAHAGDLPRYRGNACPNWTILNGEAQVGLCIHQMVPELDAGPVWQRDYFPLNDSIYIGDVYAWLHERIPQLFELALKKIALGHTPEALPDSNHIKPLRCFPRRPSDAQIFWHQSVKWILRLIRASAEPFSGAFTFLDSGEKVLIWRAQEHRICDEFLAVPGQICFADAGHPVIACGDGLLRIERCQVADANQETSLKILVQSFQQRLK